MTKRALISHEDLLQRLDYDRETGVFTWKEHPANGTNKVAGKRAGTISNGYRQIGLSKILYKGHRLAWFYVHKVWPGLVIDHINGNKDDNRIENLRDVTQSVNMQNLHVLLSNNTSGVVGVSWHKGTQSWRADIKINRKQKFLGRFKTFEAAVAAREAAKREIHSVGWH